MELLESSENKITKNKTVKMCSILKLHEVVLVHCDIVNNDY